MNGTLIVASYAAIVATAGVIWQIFLWRTEQIGRLSVEAKAHWSLFGKAISVSITNRNSYEIPLKGAILDASGGGSAFSLPTSVADLNLPKVIPARSNVQWRVDEEQLHPYSLSLFKKSEVKVEIITGIGRRESASTTVENLDEHNRARTTKAMGELTEVSYGDLVCIREDPTISLEAYKGRVGTIRAYQQSTGTFQVMFDDFSSIRAPVADIKLVTRYDDRLRELDYM